VVTAVVKGKGLRPAKVAVDVGRGPPIAAEFYFKASRKVDKVEGFALSYRKLFL